MATTNNQSRGNAVRYMVLAGMLVAAFFGAYQFAQARSGAPDASGSAALAAGDPAVGTDAAAGCSCCGSSAPTENGLTGEPVEGVAQLEGDTQAISVDLTAGYYQPNVIKLAAGVPAKVTFGQSTGCTGQVMSKDLGFFEDLTAGPVTVELPALEAGEYPFSCSMEMVFGKIVVE